MCLRAFVKADPRSVWLGIVVLFLVCATPAGASPMDAGAAPSLTVLAASLDAAISPAQADMLDAALAQARDRRAAFLLLRLNTPGGSIEVMRRMVMSLLGSPVPVVIWVGPSGARAASAGVFLAAAATTLAMAPQTTIGSASPVGLGGSDIKGTINTKIKNDLLSLLHGMSKRSGRNDGWYARAVTQAANLDAMEAVKLRVADMIAVSENDLLEQLGKRGVATPQGTLPFVAEDVRLLPFEPGLRYTVLSWLLDPGVAYVLLLVGLALLYFEVTTPGAIFPGVFGSLALLLALYALSVLPTNAAGLLLLVLGCVFFGLEVHIVSYGLLGFAGVLSLFIGSLLLFRGSGIGMLPLRLILPTVIGLSVFLGLLGYVVARSQLSRPKTGQDALVGQTALVKTWSGLSGKVLVRGELWDATSPVPLALVPEQQVTVQSVSGLVLGITANPAQPGENAS